MDDETARAFNALNARLHVVENAIDIVFTCASGHPLVRQFLLEGFQLRIAATQEGMAGSNDAAAKLALRQAYERLLEALDPPGQTEDGPAPT